MKKMYMKKPRFRRVSETTDHFQTFNYVLMVLDHAFPILTSSLMSEPPYFDFPQFTTQVILCQCYQPKIWPSLELDKTHYQIWFFQKITKNLLVFARAPSFIAWLNSEHPWISPTPSHPPINPPLPPKSDTSLGWVILKLKRHRQTDIKSLATAHFFLRNAL